MLRQPARRLVGAQARKLDASAGGRVHASIIATRLARMMSARAA